MIHKVDRRQLLVIVFLAICLIAMLGASLWHRITDPALTISHFRQADQKMPEGANGNMVAIGQLMETVSRNPHDIQALLRLTESLMAAGQWQGAQNFAQKALAEPGENSRAMYLLAVIHHNQGRHKEAAELLEKLLEKEDNPSARYSLAILYIHFLNMPEEGRNQLLKGLASEGTSPNLIQVMQEEVGKLPPAAIEPGADVLPQKEGEQ